VSVPDQSLPEHSARPESACVHVKSYSFRNIALKSLFLGGVIDSQLKGR
jgi:hypothetical protein